MELAWKLLQWVLGQSMMALVWTVEVVFEGLSSEGALLSLGLEGAGSHLEVEVHTLSREMERHGLTLGVKLAGVLMELLPDPLMCCRIHFLDVSTYDIATIDTSDNL